MLPVAFGGSVGKLAPNAPLDRRMFCFATNQAFNRTLLIFMTANIAAWLYIGITVVCATMVFTFLRENNARMAKFNKTTTTNNSESKQVSILVLPSNSVHFLHTQILVLSGDVGFSTATNHQHYINTSNSVGSKSEISIRLL